MADAVTMNVSDCVKQMGVNISALSRKTKISDNALRRSIVNRERDLRAGEFMDICKFLGKNPLDFYPENGRGGMDAQDSA
ncbi:MAG: hypothetical protein K2O84_10635 [Oscillospiraceae bacterium]|nr:hypothetical protein [Oscillospiraceae bacterium]